MAIHENGWKIVGRGSASKHGDRIFDRSATPGEKLSIRIKNALEYIDTDTAAQARIEAALAEARDTGKINDLKLDVIAELLEKGVIQNPYKFGLGSFVKYPDAKDWNDNGSHQEA